jgi:hypothetical protein
VKPSRRKSSKSHLLVEDVHRRFQELTEWVKLATSFARSLDRLGAAQNEKLSKGDRGLAEVRDNCDFAFARFLSFCRVAARQRAEKTRSLDLLVDVAMMAQGDGTAALHLIRRYHQLFGPEDSREPESFPDSFAWETYELVSALNEIADEFPEHCKHSARQMHGWPMIVSQHIDPAARLAEVAQRLDLGSEYPLDVSPRRRRGKDSPLLHYLEPLVWRTHVTRKVLRETQKTRSDENFISRLYGFWWEYPDSAPTLEVVNVLRRLSDLPDLTRKTAPEWSRKVIVPLIMATDAATAATCTILPLRNIWRHRSVKSPRTFASRLHAAVTDTLQRFGRSP